MKEYIVYYLNYVEMSRKDKKQNKTGKPKDLELTVAGSGAGDHCKCSGGNALE